MSTDNNESSNNDFFRGRINVLAAEHKIKVLFKMKIIFYIQLFSKHFTCACMCSVTKYFFLRFTGTHTRANKVRFDRVLFFN